MEKNEKGKRETTKKRALTFQPERVDLPVSTESIQPVVPVDESNQVVEVAQAAEAIVIDLNNGSSTVDISSQNNINGDANAASGIDGSSLTEIDGSAHEVITPLDDLEYDPLYTANPGADAASPTLPFTYVEIDNGANIKITGLNQDLANYEIPNKVGEKPITAIADYAFHEQNYDLNATPIIWGLSGTITIPKSVTSIGEPNFTKCKLLTEIIVESDNPNYSSENGVLFDKGKTKLLAYPLGKTDTSYEIPASVTEIGTYAMASTWEGNLQNRTFTPSLATIKGHNNITLINNDAFSYSLIDNDGFNSLSGITDILPGAFYGCENLNEINVPENLRTDVNYNNNTWPLNYSASPIFEKEDVTAYVDSEARKNELVNANFDTQVKDIKVNDGVDQGARSYIIQYETVLEGINLSDLTPQKQSEIVSTRKSYFNGIFNVPEDQIFIELSQGSVKETAIIIKKSKSVITNLALEATWGNLTEHFRKTVADKSGENVNDLTISVSSFSSEPSDNSSSIIRNGFIFELMDDNASYRLVRVFDNSAEIPSKIDGNLVKEIKAGALDGMVEVTMPWSLREQLSQAFPDNNNAEVIFYNEEPVDLDFSKEAFYKDLPKRGIKLNLRGLEIRNINKLPKPGLVKEGKLLLPLVAKKYEAKNRDGSNLIFPKNKEIFLEQTDDNKLFGDKLSELVYTNFLPDEIVPNNFDILDVKVDNGQENTNHGLVFSSSGNLTIDTRAAAYSDISGEVDVVVTFKVTKEGMEDEGEICFKVSKYAKQDNGILYGFVVENSDSESELYAMGAISDMDKITIPDSVNIEPFGNLSVLGVEEKAFINSSPSDVVIPASVESLGNDAFSNMNKEGHVCIFGSRKFEKADLENAFSDDDSLPKFYVESNLAAYKSEFQNSEFFSIEKFIKLPNDLPLNLPTANSLYELHLSEYKWETYDEKSFTPEFSIDNHNLNGKVELSVDNKVLTYDRENHNQDESIVLKTIHPDGHSRLDRLIFDNTIPQILDAAIWSSNECQEDGGPKLARVEDTITLTFKTSEVIQQPTAKITFKNMNGDVEVIKTSDENTLSLDNNIWKFEVTIPDNYDNMKGTLGFSISDIEDLAGNSRIDRVSNDKIDFDSVKPIIESSSMVSNNVNNNALAKEGDTVTVEFTTSEAIKSEAKVVFIDSNGKEQETTATQVSGNPKNWKAEVIMERTDPNGAITFEIKDVMDLAGNPLDKTNNNHKDGGVTFDKTPPYVKSAIFSSNNDCQDDKSKLAKPGNQLKLEIEFSEPIRNTIDSKWLDPVVGINLEYFPEIFKWNQDDLDDNEQLLVSIPKCDIPRSCISSDGHILIGLSTDFGDANRKIEYNHYVVKGLDEDKEKYEGTRMLEKKSGKDPEACLCYSGEDSLEKFTTDGITIGEWWDGEAKALVKVDVSSEDDIKFIVEGKGNYKTSGLEGTMHIIKEYSFEDFEKTYKTDTDNHILLLNRYGRGNESENFGPCAGLYKKYVRGNGNVPTINGKPIYIGSANTGWSGKPVILVYNSSKWILTWQGYFEGSTIDDIIDKQPKNFGGLQGLRDGDITNVDDAKHAVWKHFTTSLNDIWERFNKEKIIFWKAYSSPNHPDDETNFNYYHNIPKNLDLDGKYYYSIYLFEDRAGNQVTAPYQFSNHNDVIELYSNAPKISVTEFKSNNECPEKGTFANETNSLQLCFNSNEPIKKPTVKFYYNKGKGNEESYEGSGQKSENNNWKFNVDLDNNLAEKTGKLSYEISNIMDLAGNKASNVLGGNIEFDGVHPTIRGRTFTSNNACQEENGPKLAKVDDVLKLYFTTSEVIKEPSVRFFHEDSQAELSGVDLKKGQAKDGDSNLKEGQVWCASYKMKDSDKNGLYNFMIKDLMDKAGNDLVGDNYTLVSDDHMIRFDKTPPEIIQDSISFESNNKCSNEVAKNGDMITLSFSTDEAIKKPVVKFKLGELQFGPTSEEKSNESTQWTFKTKVSSEILQNGYLGPYLTYDISEVKDLAGNPMKEQPQPLEIRFDNKAPSLFDENSLEFKTSNKLNFVAMPGDKISLNFTLDEEVKLPKVYFLIGGEEKDLSSFVQSKPTIKENEAAKRIFPAISAWCVEYTLKKSDRDGNIGYRIELMDKAGNTNEITNNRSHILSQTSEQFSVRDDLESNNKKEYTIFYHPMNVNPKMNIKSDKYTSLLDSEIKCLEGKISMVENCYKELCRTKLNIKRQKAAGNKNLKSQRLRAKKHIEKKICNLVKQVEYLDVSINHNGFDAPSLCDKLKSLGRKSNIEGVKSNLMAKLTDVALVDFENVSMYQKNSDSDDIKHFLEWVDRNKVYATADEVVSNIDANKQRLRLANVKLNEFKDMLMKVRELAILYADDSYSDEQKKEFCHEIESLYEQIIRVIKELEFNGENVFLQLFPLVSV